MGNPTKFWLKHFSERLWVKPLTASLLSVAGVFVAKQADGTALTEMVPAVTVESIQTLLSIMASSVLVIATLAVTSMVAAYASASTTASPRALSLVIADDRTQYALSAFVATFIYSIVALIASKNEYFGPAGRFVLFALTLCMLAVVVLTFVTWVDRIARLGRMGDTIAQVERATSAALAAQRALPCLGGHPLTTPTGRGVPVYTSSVGFLQQIDMRGLEQVAVREDLRFELVALPGTFVTPNRAIAWCISSAPIDPDRMRALVEEHILIGRDRTFEEDPRFGLLVLSQIATRAMSPAMNDAGTAIDVIGVIVRLFVERSALQRSEGAVLWDHISVTPIDVEALCDAAFAAIARDGAGSLEVVLRLLRGLEALAQLGDPSLREAVLRHVHRTVALAERAAYLPADRTRIAARARVV